MDISDDARKTILDEINYALTMMEKAHDIERKLYYFSAIYGVTQRVFNSEYDEDLVCMHSVLNQAYGSFRSRIRAFKSGDIAVPVSEQQIKKLIKLAKDLGKRIKSKESIDDILKAFVVLSYTTTGNGYYLLERGKLNI
jgi:hypothetical protein